MAINLEAIVSIGISLIGKLSVGASSTVSLPDVTSSSSAYLLQDSVDDRIAIDSSLLAGGGTGYLSQLELVTVITGIYALRLTLSRTLTDIGGAAGPNFIDAVVENEIAFTFVNVTSGTSIIVPGSNTSSSSSSDSDEPYFWLPKNIGAFRSWFNAREVGDVLTVNISSIPFDTNVYLESISVLPISIVAHLSVANPVDVDLAAIIAFSVDISPTLSIFSVSLEISIDLIGTLSVVSQVVPLSSLLPFRISITGSISVLLSGSLLLEGSIGTDVDIVSNLSVEGPAAVSLEAHVKIDVDIKVALSSFYPDSIGAFTFGDVVYNLFLGRTGSYFSSDGTTELLFSASSDKTLDEAYRVSDFNGITSSIPMIHLGDRSVRSTPSMYTYEDMPMNSAIYLYLVDNIVLRFTRSSVSLVAFIIDMFDSLTGESISVFNVGGSFDAISFDSVSGAIIKVEYVVGDVLTSVVYGLANQYEFTSVPIVPVNAVVTRGRDSQRQLSPPRVPAMTCTFWDEAGALYYSRGYESGATVSLFSVLPTGRVIPMFTGLIDKIRYSFSKGAFTYSIDALGMTSRLIRGELFGEIRAGITIAECIKVSLFKANWISSLTDTTNFSMSDSEFDVVLSHWWLDGDEPWGVLNRLVNTQGPPATFYEDNLGGLIFLGTGVDRVPVAGDVIPLGNEAVGSIPVIGDTKEGFEANYIVNHASINVVEYAESDGDVVIWNRSSVFTILPGATFEVVASFSNPVLNYANTVEPSFQSTVSTLNVSYKKDGLSATRAVMLFDNSASTGIAEVRRITILGTVLVKQSDVEVSSDGLEQSVPSVTDSIDTHGVKEWRGNVYKTLTESYGRFLVRSIVQNYHEGVDTSVLSIFPKTMDDLTRLSSFDDITSVRNETLSDDPQTFVRKFTHTWNAGFYFVKVEVESRSLSFFGVSPFLFSSSTTNSEKGYSS